MCTSERRLQEMVPYFQGSKEGLCLAGWHLKELMMRIAKSTIETKRNIFNEYVLLAMTMTWLLNTTTVEAFAVDNVKLRESCLTSPYMKGRSTPGFDSRLE